MADPIRGHGGYLGLAEQVAFDTPVAPTHFLTCKSLNIGRRIERADVEILGYPGEAPVAHDSYDRNEVVEGSTVHLLGYNDPTMLLLKHCMGAVTTTGAGPTWDHEYELADDVPSGTEGLTGQQAYGSGPLSNRAETFTGLVVAGFSIGAAFEEMVEFEVRWMGRTGSGPTSPVSPTLVDAPSRAEHHHLTSGGITIGGVKLEQLQRWRVNVERALAPVNEVGSLVTQKPVPDGMFEVTLELEWLWSANTQYAAHLAGTFAAVAFTLTDGTHAYVFDLARCQMGPVTREASSPGVLRCSATLKAYATATDGALVITLTNDKATPETV